MADTIKVEPTPIQRNTLDVAMELTQLYVSLKVVDGEQLDTLFARFYALAKTLEHTNHKLLSDLIPKELLKSISP